jgi:NAD+ synthase (glutamine-hydrolysing)
VVYENAQARERTQILMDVANAEGGLVIGTGDLSELALGFATYNGDHMSMYAPNAGVPKTLMRYLVSHLADEAEAAGRAEEAGILRDVLATPVSPELLPPKDGEIAQCTENIVGPYELHDYFLYHLVRNRFSPDKILRLAEESFKGTYDKETIKGWLKIFIRRFFSQQFKRSCLPDGPRIGSVTLSPRGGFVMPSDATSALWLAALDNE